MSRVRPGGYRRRGAAGVAFAYFSLLGLPVLFFGAGLATDFTRIIIAARQVTNATQASALAGAQQFAPDTRQLNGPAAISKATETFCYAQSAGVMSLSAPAGDGVECPAPTTGRASITVTPVSSGFNGADPIYTQIDVTTTYRVEGLIFTSMFGQGHSFDADPITRTAAVCVPGVPDGPTLGYCTHASDEPARTTPTG